MIAPGPVTNGICALVGTDAGKVGRTIRVTATGMETERTVAVIAYLIQSLLLCGEHVVTTVARNIALVGRLVEIISISFFHYLPHDRGVKREHLLLKYPGHSPVGGQTVIRRIGESAEAYIAVGDGGVPCQITLAAGCLDVVCHIVAQLRQAVNLAISQNGLVGDGEHAALCIKGNGVDITIHGDNLDIVRREVLRSIYRGIISVRNAGIHHTALAFGSALDMYGIVIRLLHVTNNADVSATYTFAGDGICAVCGYILGWNGHQHPVGIAIVVQLLRSVHVVAILQGETVLYKAVLGKYLHRHGLSV